MVTGNQLGSCPEQLQVRILLLSTPNESSNKYLSINFSHIMLFFKIKIKNSLILNLLRFNKNDFLQIFILKI